MAEVEDESKIGGAQIHLPANIRSIRSQNPLTAHPFQIALQVDLGLLFSLSSLRESQ